MFYPIWSMGLFFAMGEYHIIDELGQGQESKIWALLALNKSFWGPQKLKKFDFSKPKNESVDNKFNFFSIN